MLRVADDFYPASVLGNRIALGDGIRRVVGAFGLYVGANLGDDGSHIGFGENHHRVHVCERGNDLGAFRLGHNGPSLALELPHGLIRINCDHQPASESLGSAQISHVTYVQQIESAVSEDDRLAAVPPGLHVPAEFLPSHDFFACAQCGLVAGGAWSMACSNSSRETVAVPRFMTTTPPA